MERRLFNCLILFWMGLFVVSSASFAYEKPDESITTLDPMAEISMRFSAQWEISKVDKHALDMKYGTNRVHFDSKGQPIPKGIAPQCMKRWLRLYKLCMSDGCYYCDANEGSCETGTCGAGNTQCKPYVDGNGVPKCGSVCADYAFAATLY